jgi:hypothetical protein
LWFFLASVKDFVASVGGICGAETEVIVNLKPESKDDAIAAIKKRCVIKKSTGSFMFELEFGEVTFRLFMSGKLIFRGVRNRMDLDRLLVALLLN